MGKEAHGKEAHGKFVGKEAHFVGHTPSIQRFAAKQFVQVVEQKSTSMGEWCSRHGVSRERSRCWLD
jgi:hypothetical protein